MTPPQLVMRRELDIELVRVGKGQPRVIALPANRTLLIQFEAPADAKTEGHTYKATNFLVGPDEPMTVELKIPE
ncbi:MAG: hypothetical protein JXA69_08850 [Phycisphaerae bacterium]|nr:hypothetical protein [Phycisphaerae bacterium]